MPNVLAALTWISCDDNPAGLPRVEPPDDEHFSQCVPTTDEERGAPAASKFALKGLSVHFVTQVADWRHLSDSTDLFSLGSRGACRSRWRLYGLRGWMSWLSQPAPQPCKLQAAWTCCIVLMLG
jgi:hypothetical protein